MTAVLGGDRVDGRQRNGRDGVRGFQDLGRVVPDDPFIRGRLEGDGARFGVWAPNAAEVSVIGEWNGWDPTVDRLHPRADHSGIWEGQVSAARHGQTYKFHIVSRHGGYRVDKADPYALVAEQPPATAASIGLKSGSPVSRSSS